VARILEWLTGASDIPPAYTLGTQPGDLVGGRGPVVRTPAAIAAAAARAQGNAGAQAALEWAAGQRTDRR
jgi:hypothetical protein